MKLGLIVEGIPDAQVCEYLAKRINPDLEVDSVPLQGKPKLLEGCGRIAKLLLDEGVDRVVVVWDLFPAQWEHSGSRIRARNRETKHSCELDHESFSRALERAGVDLRRVCLVCIDAMLETWLLADIRALNTVLSTKTRHVKFKKPPQLERNQDPKSLMIKNFRKEGRGGNTAYDDSKDALKIAEAIPREKGKQDLKKLRKFKSFEEFERCVSAEKAVS